MAGDLLVLPFSPQSACADDTVMRIGQALGGVGLDVAQDLQEFLAGGGQVSHDLAARQHMRPFEVWVYAGHGQDGRPGAG